MGPAPQIAVFLVSILVVAFFSSSEAGLVSMNSSHIGHSAATV
ncbi:MAG: hypothetical protein HW388_1726 [Dehalococcoidia bacterium]|nr:hypothetical protein [Dehalococcoidia bacterium]